MRTVWLAYLWLLIIICPLPAADNPPQQDQNTPKKDEDIYNIEADVSEGVYKQGEQVLVLTGNVKVVHGTTTLTCEKAVSREAEKMLTAEGNVKVVDSKNQMILTCGYGEYYRDKKYVVAMKSPVLVSTKNVDQPLTITADLMEEFLDSELGVATGNVHVVSGESNATGSSCNYYGKEGRIDLLGEPVAWQRDSKLVGDKMTLVLRSQKVEEALVENNVRLLYYSAKKKKESTEEAKQRKLEEGKAADTTPPKPPTAPVELEAKGKPNPAEEEPPLYNGRLESSGDLLHAYFRDDELRVAFIEGTAKGVYFPFDDFGKETGETLTVTGNRLTAYFGSGTVDSIVSEDNAVSVYFPPAGQEGKTITQGEIISMYILDGKIDRILVRGEAKGNYFGKPATTTSSSNTTSEKEIKK